MVHRGGILVWLAACGSTSTPQPHAVRPPPARPATEAVEAAADRRGLEEASSLLCAVGPAQERHFARHGRYATASAEPNPSDHGSSKPITSGWDELALPLPARPRCEYEVWAVAADQSAGPMRGVAGATGRAAPAGPSWYAQAICRDQPHLLVLLVRRGGGEIEDLSPPSPRGVSSQARCPSPARDGVSPS